MKKILDTKGRLKTLLVIGLILIISLFFLGGYKSPELKAMENSASVLQLTKGHEVERYITDKHSGFTGPIYPEVLIVYEPINNYTQKEVYVEIMTILENNNWERDKSYIFPDGFKAYLQHGYFKIITNVNIDSRNNHVIVKMIIY